MRKLLGVLLMIFIGFALNEVLHRKGVTLPFLPQAERSREIFRQNEKKNETALPPIKSPNFISRAAKIAIKGVVNIDTVFFVRNKSPFSDFFGDDPVFKRFFSGEPIPQKGMGSGFIIKANRHNGIVLTNEHVVTEAKRITVTLADKRRIKAKVIGRDKRLDIAVLKIDGDDLPTLKLGDSDKLQLGEWVMAIGNPFGFGHTVSAGIVSALHRKIQHPESGEVMENLIQTDAAINRGNSGGPLVNLRGEVVGMDTVIYSPSGGSVGIGFAISINNIKTILKQLIEKGKVTWPARPWIGVGIDELSNLPEECPHPKEKRGIYVGRVYRETPAAKAGLLPCDVILSIEGKPIQSPDDLITRIRKHKVGHKIKLEIWRDGSIVKKQLKLEKFPGRRALQ